MRRIMILATAVLLSAASCIAGGKKEVVTVKDIPAAAQQLLNTCFANQPVSYVVRETELLKVEYEVRFEGGAEVEFDADGNWKKIDCKAAAVPEALVPVEILNKVRQSFPGAVIVDIEKDWKGYDVELGNGLDIEFDNKFNMRIDD